MKITKKDTDFVFTKKIFVTIKAYWYIFAILGLLLWRVADVFFTVKVENKMQNTELIKHTVQIENVYGRLSVIELDIAVIKTQMDNHSNTLNRIESKVEEGNTIGRANFYKPPLLGKIDSVKNWKIYGQKKE
ncbi:MAG: hypothetical protein PHW73_01085 [Atribacterota bacterium]|nr:hypothetical protein [Atribacterota bacterium]